MIILEQHLDRQENSLLIQKGPAQRFSLIRKRYHPDMDHHYSQNFRKNPRQCYSR